MKKFLVVLPAHNEEAAVGKVLDDILNLPLRDKFDVLVVNDGSVDNTEEVCRMRDVTVITHIFCMGYGAALKTAYKYARENGYEYVIQLDADGQHDVQNVVSLYDVLISEGSPDIVIGSRFLQGSVAFHTPAHKKLVIRIFRGLIHLATKQKITDPTSGLQGIKRRAFCFYAKYNYFSIDFPDANMIIQMLMNDFSLGEIPAVMYPRTIGVSMHHGLIRPAKYLIKVGLSIFAIYFREITTKTRWI